ncbi:50S ribosomal protein L11 methyltransferase [Castellaniella sp.]|uniref:50S ribosomal protein L11 methyltransferase n=1 Tax=Castellaniella sp. TaxID=1955812 RepID=UPI003A94D2A5
MRELVLNCTENQADAWSDALLDAGALSVSLEDADGDTEQEQALFGEPGTEPETLAWRRNRLVALLPDGEDPRHLLAALEGQAGPAPAEGDWLLRTVPDADWVRLTQSQFGPITVGKRIWIVPSWHREDEGLPSAGVHDGVVRIELDPGLAFGTGSHPTTHLCLEWLSEHLQGGETVLDYGCGSGILAIAARLLGAGDTWAVDIDEQAVLSTHNNAAVNQVALNACLPDGLSAGTRQVVVANILSNPLKVLAPMLSSRVSAGGSLVLSGVIERQAAEVAQAYAPWLALDVWAARDGWVCLAGQKA